MSSSLDSPKVFISYSWKPIAHKEKTRKLAERLESDGVNVVIDIWNLAEGQDKYKFMEQMINDAEVKKVLIICNEEYSAKANSRSGGVGTESLIISNEIYSQAEQTKFIPIIFERDEAGKEILPTFVNSRIYIDLSNDKIFEEEYERLMRNLFDKPANPRPPRGNPPPYIQIEESIYLRTIHKVKAVENALVNEKQNSQAFIDDYFTTFLEALSDFSISKEEITNEEFIDETIFIKIEALKTLRNDFIDFFEILLTYSANLNVDKIISFLEKIIEFFTKVDSEKNQFSNGNYMTDHYKFFFYELFLYLVTIMIEKEKFEELGEILSVSFLIYNSRYNKTMPYSFVEFRPYVESLDKIRNERLNLRRLSLTADLIKQRADISKYDFDKLKETDILLYYRSLMRKDIQNDMKSKWFPLTSVYDTYNIKIIDKLISKRYFEKIKFIFKINTKEELQSNVKFITENDLDKTSRFDHNIPYVDKVFDFDKIGTLN
jgi:hypothetical protein